MKTIVFPSNRSEGRPTGVESAQGIACASKCGRVCKESKCRSGQRGRNEKHRGRRRSAARKCFKLPELVLVDFDAALGAHLVDDATDGVNDLDVRIGFAEYDGLVLGFL